MSTNDRLDGKGRPGDRRRPRDRQGDRRPARRGRRSVVIASRKKENLEAAAAELAGLAGKVVPIVCHLGQARSDRGPGPGDRVAARAGRHPGQQQRHQRGAGARARRHRRHARQDGRDQHQGGSAADPADGPADDRARPRGLDHQRQLDLGPAASGRGLALQLHQGGPDHDDPVLGTRVRQARHPRQRPGARPDPDRLQRLLLGRRRRGAKSS